MKQPPLVSIVTPCYNGASYIEQAILNVLEQGVENFEHIIIDGASQDGTVEILRRYPNVRWLSEPDTGQANALNKGFRMAQGDIIGWLNGDDTYTPGAIQTGLNYLLTHPECDIVYGDCNILRSNGSLLTVFRPKQTQGWEQLLGGWIHTPAVFFRRHVFDRVGYLDERLRYVLDNEFWLRAAPLVRQDYLPQALANFHHQLDSKSLASFANFGPEMCLIYEEMFNREPYTSKIPLDMQRQMLARCFWHCGIQLVLNDRGQQGEIYVRQAIKRFDLMRYREIATEGIITRYIQRDILPWKEVESLIAALPLEELVRIQLLKWCRHDYWHLRFYSAYNRRDWAEVRCSGLNEVLRHPANLRLRGFLSIWAESILGSRIVNTMRELM